MPRLNSRYAQWTQAATTVTLLLALGLPLAAIGAARPSVDAVAEGLTCQCGCGLTVANCNHPQCEFSVPMRTQIEGMIAKGLGRSTILATFRTKYGEKILSAPTTEGFNLMAWLMPFGVLLVGGALIFGAFGRWRSHAPVTATEARAVDAVAFDPALRERLESAIREDL
jgi:cytochrome c-type biogenesis protein CcmH/NrfF